MKTLLAAMTFTVFTLLGQSAYADPAVNFLISNENARVVDSHQAVINTPIAQPFNAVQWKWDQAEAQEVINSAFPNNRNVVKPIQVVRENGRDESELSEVDLREELNESRHLLSDR